MRDTNTVLLLLLLFAFAGVRRCGAAVQLMGLPEQFRDARHFAASCTRGSGKGIELTNAVLYAGQVYCANGKATTGVSSARLPTPKHDGRGSQYVQDLPIVATDAWTADPLPQTCTFLPEHTAFVGLTYWPQIGHFVYNTVSSLFSVLGLVEAHAAGPHVYTRARATLNGSLQLFLYPDLPARLLRWSQELWQPVISPSSTAAEIFRVLTRHPAMSLPALLNNSTTQAFCFRKLTLGLSGSTLDHYMPRVPPGHWRIFIDALADGMNARAVPRCHRATTNIVVVQRRKSRRFLNAEEMASAVHELFDRSSAGPVHVQVVLFEDLAFAQQAQLMSQTDIMIGVDGTGLFNGNFMPPGSYVVRVKPYALDVLIPGKSGNFKRIWEALGLRQLEWTATQLNQTEPAIGVGQLQALIAATQNGTALTRSQRTGPALSQNTRVDVSELRRLLMDAVETFSKLDCRAKQHLRS